MGDDHFRGPTGGRPQVAHESLGGLDVQVFGGFVEDEQVVRRRISAGLVVDEHSG